MSRTLRYAVFAVLLVTHPLGACVGLALGTYLWTQGARNAEKLRGRR